MDALRSVALGAIRLYQRFVSPHKGFACAYRAHTGRCGCSQLGYRAIRRYGLGKGWLVLRQRTWLCGVAHRRHAPAPSRPLARERGDCDCGLPCDLDLFPSSGKWNVCDGFSCCDVAGCDWPSRNDRQRDARNVYIPPYSMSGDRQPRAAPTRSSSPSPTRGHGTGH